MLPDIPSNSLVTVTLVSNVDLCYCVKEKGMAHIQKSTGYNVQWMSTISLCRFFEIPYGRSFYYVSLSSDLRQPPHQICGVLGLQIGS
jgi:hypothetical protein